MSDDTKTRLASMRVEPMPERPETDGRHDHPLGLMHGRSYVVTAGFITDNPDELCAALKRLERRG